MRLPEHTPRGPFDLHEPRYGLAEIVERGAGVHGLRDQNLRLLRQARHVHEARRAPARTPAHEALLRFPVEGLRADEARLALRVLGARLDRDRDGLLTIYANGKLFWRFLYQFF